MAKRPIPRIIAIAGGKGGTGKSTVAVNLAVAIGRSGHSVTVVDADLGAANLHTMFGVLHPEHTLADFLDHNVESLDDLTVQVAPSVWLAPGTSRPGSANLSHSQRLRVLRAITRLEADVVVVDIGAGTSYTVIDLLAGADHKLFVLTPQLPSLHNAYALLKASVYRVMRKLAADETSRDLIDAALGQENRARTVPQLLSVLRPLEPGLADQIVHVLRRYGAGFVGNQLGTDAESDVFARISKLVYEHLLIHAPVLATVRRSRSLSGGLRGGTGTVAERGESTYDAFAQLARTLLDIDLEHLRGAERTQHQRTMPLWIQRELREAAE